MKKYLFISLLTLSACSYGPSLRDTQIAHAQNMAQETDSYYQDHGEKKTIKAAIEAVKKTLKDPNSAQFNNVRVVKYANGRLVCGEVNSKNSYGGYVGFAPFLASSAEAQLSQRNPDDQHYQFIYDAANVAINQACS